MSSVTTARRYLIRVARPSRAWRRGLMERERPRFPCLSAMLDQPSPPAPTAAENRERRRNDCNRQSGARSDEEESSAGMRLVTPMQASRRDFAYRVLFFAVDNTFM